MSVDTKIPMISEALIYCQNIANILAIYWIRYWIYWIYWQVLNRCSVNQEIAHHYEGDWLSLEQPGQTGDGESKHRELSGAYFDESEE